MTLLYCNDIEVVNDEYSQELPAHFPSINFPEGNELTAARIALGKHLFYDKNLSSDRSLSCASCHLPEYAFSDTVSLSKGVHGRIGERNAPSLTNVAYNKAFFRDGGSPTLELQSMGPIEDSNEMNLNILDAVKRMEENDWYIQMSNKAYGRTPDTYVLTRALGAFQRTIISGNAKYDQYKKGEIAFTKEEKEGMKLFFGDKTSCSSCHSGYNFTNYQYENIGLYEHYTDSGRMRITLKEEDRNKFVVPSLRNIAVTAPYMHDGSIQTLRDVILFFNSGGYDYDNKNNSVRPLNLTEQEINALEAFLKTLTDDGFLENKTLTLKEESKFPIIK